MDKRLTFTFALTGRREWGHGTQGVALGWRLVGLSARAGPHNRLLRRQHCSSLCSQSEGHEHVANMVRASGHDLVGFLARAWPPQYSSPSLCEQSELQCFASDFRRMSAHRPLQRRRNRHAIWSKLINLFFHHYAKARDDIDAVPRFCVVNGRRCLKKRTSEFGENVIPRLSPAPA